MQKCKNLPRSLCSLAYIDYLDVGVLPAVCEAFIVPVAYLRGGGGQGGGQTAPLTSNKPKKITMYKRWTNVSTSD